MTSTPKMGHEPVTRPRLGPSAARVDAVWIDRFMGIDTCAIADAVGPLYTMDSGLRPLHPSMSRIVGQALTARCWPGDNLAVHGALARACANDVLVVDWGGYMGGCGGGALSLSEPFKKGLRGVIIDGTWRDIAELAANDMPVVGRGVNASSPAKLRPGEVNVVVHCGGVIVKPGDLVVADEEGSVVVPLEYLDAVWHEVSEVTPVNEARVGSTTGALGRNTYFDLLFTEQNGIDEFTR